MSSALSRALGSGRRHVVKPNPIRWSHWDRSLASAMVAIALLLSGCGTTDPVSYTPEISGIVATREPGPDGSIRITLRDGDSQTIDLDDVHVVAGNGLPDVGELFLAGSSPDPWIGALNGLNGQESCFWIGGGGDEEGGFITTDSGGLRLPESADFDRRNYDETEHRFERGGFCVNGSGEITAIR
jgi:hypothetical protein